MSTIVTRAGKGSALTHTEVDANFTNLNTDKLQSGNTAAALTITSATINGGAINSTTVGATTPASGSFSSLTDSGNLTFTGTGNRITGDFSNATAANRVSFQSSTTNGNTIVPFIPNGAATQTNLALYNGSDVTTNFSLFTIRHNTTASSFASAIGGTGAYVPMTFETNGSERMRVDTSGNVGIGTSAPRARLDLANGVLTGVGNIGGQADTGAYTIWGGHSTLNGAYVQLWGASSANANVLIFGNASTERARIDSSGNVGIGTASPGAKLDVRGSSTFLVNATNPTAWTSVDSALTTGSMYNQWNTTSNVGISGTYTNHPYTFVTNNTERMRITSAGNVAIGTSSPVSGARLATVGGPVQLSGGTTSQEGIRIQRVSGYASITGINNDNNAYNPIAFFTSGTEAARIDSSNNFLIGKTSPGYTTSGVSLSNSTNQFAWSGNSGSVVASFATPVNQSQIGFYRTDTGGLMGTISNGASNTVAYNTSSDYRLKDNVKPMTGALAKVAALRPVTWTWREDGIAGEGFIAHEVQAIVPDAVTGEKDAVDDKGNPRFQGIDTSFLVATLTAAIQEQQQMIETLQAEVAALKGA